MESVDQHNCENKQAVDVVMRLAIIINPIIGSLKVNDDVKINTNSWRDLFLVVGITTKKFRAKVSIHVRQMLLWILQNCLLSTL